MIITYLQDTKIYFFLLRSEHAAWHVSATNVRSQLSPETCSTKKLVMAPPGDQMAERHKKGFEHPPGDQGSNFFFTFVTIWNIFMLISNLTVSEIVINTMLKC